ncbi:Uncharacterized protein containing double-stranded beta helix domain [Leclercia adecarboxylata]|uniref:Uncharacterized protein containing double-stranded beta helix domain n=1 Tax=Leclercia adecarboxylata TaxID=83655 RepID=A0A4U9IL35_9ENTR|nr:Uncharacterized protein containing double-stranded beta helix domain [Leclercia adecarboxylata]
MAILPVSLNSALPTTAGRLSGAMGFLIITITTPLRMKSWGFSRGAARLVIGGPGGEEVEVEAGDALLLPAGTGHCRLSATLDFQVVGAYPPGMEFDLCKQAATPAVLSRIVSLPFPEQDPVNGNSLPLTQYWKTPPFSP